MKVAEDGLGEAGWSDGEGDGREVEEDKDNKREVRCQACAALRCAALGQTLRRVTAQSQLQLRHYD